MLADAESVLMAEIRSTSAALGPRSGSRPGGRRPRLVMVGVVVAAFSVAAAVVTPWRASTSGSHTREVSPDQHSRAAVPVNAGGAFHSKADLVTRAITAAAVAPPLNPGPHHWTFIKSMIAAPAHGPSWASLHGPPYRRVTQESWVRVDRGAIAELQNGKVVTNPNVGEPDGWPRSTYRYLNSLPSDPAKLEAVIASNVTTPPMSRAFGVAEYGLDQAIFEAIQALLENVVVPPPLLAGLYGVLGRLHFVHFDRSVTDFAGRTGVGLYMIIEGYLKLELIINPSTFALMGVDSVAIKAHTSVGTDATVHYKKGQVVGLWAIWLGIVSRAGEVP
jgi:hypothetical protein